MTPRIGVRQCGGVCVYACYVYYSAPWAATHEKFQGGSFKCARIAPENMSIHDRQTRKKAASRGCRGPQLAQRGRGRLGGRARESEHGGPGGLGE